MTRFIDTHCHLDLLDKSADQVIKEAKKLGVEQIVTIATDTASQIKVNQIIRTWPQVFGTAGVHPHSASEYGKSTTEQIRKTVLNENKIIAIGEIGLDYHYLHSPKNVQKNVFREQLLLAEELNLPVVLHTRDADDETLKLLKEYNPSCRGVAHSFTGSLKMAEELLAMNWYLGFNGIITFKNAGSLRQLIRKVPFKRILLETDAPFLSPIPFRGKENAPFRIPIIADFIADLLEVPLEELSQQTCQNAEELFGLDQSTSQLNLFNA